MMIGMTGAWPNPVALWYEDDDGYYCWSFALDAWAFYSRVAAKPNRLERSLAEEEQE